MTLGDVGRKLIVCSAVTVASYGLGFGCGVVGANLEGCVLAAPLSALAEKMAIVGLHVLTLGSAAGVGTKYFLPIVAEEVFAPSLCGRVGTETPITYCVPTVAMT